MKVECGKEKNLRCCYCESAYYYKQDLQKHMTKVHSYKFEQEGC